MRLTNRKTYLDLKNNAEKLQAKGMEVSISDLMYIKLAEYENAEEDADVQSVRHGKWIAENKDNRGYADCYTCTNCNCYTYTYTLMKDCEYDYCPNCGARMDGDKE